MQHMLLMISSQAPAGETAASQPVHRAGGPVSELPGVR